MLRNILLIATIAFLMLAFLTACVSSAAYAGFVSLPHEVGVPLFIMGAFEFMAGVFCVCAADDCW